jgi:hypothetical protein
MYFLPIYSRKIVTAWNQWAAGGGSEFSEGATAIGTDFFEGKIYGRY